ncbi:hypothetical protein O0L34_g4429 [Tuta absoluta]|nr:hypothetical protein O0L34_g4429 [Tuta absoluta]
MAIHSPKKDKCVICIKSENQESEKSDEDKIKMKKHLEEKQASYSRFKLHQNIPDPQTITASFDLQKVLNTPHGDNMLLYYARKYAMYNLTFYESRTQNVICYLWGEADGKRGGQEISSCLFLYLKDVDERGIKNLLLYCDSCCGQNRNKMVLAALNHFLQTSKNLEVIQINYLIPGHTYMPVDSVHAVIENEVRKLTVWSPSQWPNFIQTARKRPRPYEVNVLDHTDFLDFEELTAKAFTPQLAKAIKFQQLRTVTFKKKVPNEITVKYSMQENAEIQKFQLHQKVLPTLRGKKSKGKGKEKGKGKQRQEEEAIIQNQDDVMERTIMKPLYAERLPISERKYKDLKKLCEVGTIPKRFHSEYLNLPYLLEVPDTLNETDEEDQRDNEE